MENIYQSIALRTGGNIYMGVVGPVRTGKSTLIKRIMETAVIPCITDPYRRERARDELPQSGSGKTIMTSEPKFVPEEAVEIEVDGSTRLRIRLIDTVGYMVEGAAGATENGAPRMITTPWFDHEIPLTQAAELGTQKVMQEHCSIGLVVTTDGTVTDIPRQDYLDAEDRSIRDMLATGKPFLVIVNSRQPQSDPAQSLARDLENRYGVCALTADCQALTQQELTLGLKKLLYSFPLQALQVYLPRWMDALEPEDSLRSTLYNALLTQAESIHHLSDAQQALAPLSQLEQVRSVHIDNIDPGRGTVSCRIELPQELYYDLLSKKTGVQIRHEGELLHLLTELVTAKNAFDRIREALDAATTTGYGIVMPQSQDMTLQTPEIVRKGSSYGVRLKATAPSLHIIRVDIDAQISPMVGSQQQSQELMNYLTQEDPEKLWDSNLFGKSIHTLVQEGLTSKLLRTPQDVQEKIRSNISRIVNEGATGLICLIL